MAELIYYPQRGYGVLEPDETTRFLYDQSYFEMFAQRSVTLRGDRLNATRVMFVRDVIGELDDSEVMIDVGVGSGHYMELAESMLDHLVLGYDVARAPLEYLERRGRWCDLMREKVDVATFWDSLEHCTEQDARRLVSNVREFVFISMPIYESGDAIVRSKHFKPGEHILYFTERGIVRWMHDAGFEMIARNRMEEQCGRDGIGTYAFARS